MLKEMLQETSSTINSLKARTSFKNSVVQSFLLSAHRFPDQPALWATEQQLTYKQLTYKQLLTLGKTIAAGLQSEFTSPVNCAILAYRSPVAYASLWGALLAGDCYVPLNPRFPVERNLNLLQNGQCPVIIVDQRCEEAARDLLSKCPKRLTVLMPEHDELPQWCQSHNHDHDHDHDFFSKNELPSSHQWQEPVHCSPYAYLLFTSGSTGLPKGVAVTHNNLRAYIGHFQSHYDFSPEDRFSQVSDLTFDLSAHDLYLSWSSGASLFCVPEASMLCPARFIQTHALTCWVSVPSLLGYIRRFRQMKPDAFPSLRYSFFCGEALPMAMALDWQKAAPDSQVINLYGPTETTVAIASWELANTSAQQGNAPIGFPFPGQEMILVNEDRQLTDEGEIWLGGSQVTGGYWENPSLTAQAFVSARFKGYRSTRWYRTGDLGSRCPQEGILFKGRKDFQVKINGYRIELEEVEAVIRKQAACDWVAVIPWPLDQDNNASGLVAWLSGTPGDPAKVKQHCKKRLPPYMVPSNIFWRDSLPLNNNGKVDIPTLQQITQTNHTNKSHKQITQTNHTNKGTE